MDVAGIIVASCFIGIIWSAMGYLMGMLIFTEGEGSFDFFNPCWIYAHVQKL